MNAKSISVKTIVVLMGLSALFFSGSTLAESTSRADLINQVESLYFQQQFFSEDAPLLNMYLQAAKSKNASASNEDWVKIKKEATPAIAKLTMEQGAPLDMLFRESVKDMSAEELGKLLEVLNEPAFKKFQAAFTSPSTQTKFLGAMFAYTEKLKGAINQILLQHGLEEVH